MAVQQLTKHSAESRVYAFEFGPYGGPASLRDTIWGVLATQQLGALASGESLVPAMTIMLLLSLVSGLPTASITVIRSDGVGSDLTVGTPIVLTPTRIGVRVSGGTAGLGYTLTCACPTSLGNVVVVQGVLNVVSVLP